MNPTCRSVAGSARPSPHRPVRPWRRQVAALSLGVALAALSVGAAWAETVTLSPFPDDDPRAAAASRLKLAIQQLEDGDPEAALSNLATDERSVVFAPDLVAWTRGLAFSLLGRHQEADEAWKTIALDSSWAEDTLLRRAESALDDDRPGDALLVLKDANLPGAAGHRAHLLRARAFERRGGDGDLGQAYSSCKRIWLDSGRVTAISTDAEACMARLKGSVATSLHPSLEDEVTRSVALGSAHRNDAVVDLLGVSRAKLEEALSSAGASGMPSACTGLFQLGRAFHKKRLYTQSAPLMEVVTNACEGALAVKSQYLLAEGLSRSGQLDRAVASYTALADRFPDHSYADDGLYHGGRLLLAANRGEEARELFTRMADEFPQGDMLGKGLWGLAWAALADNQPAAALPWLERVARGDAHGANRERVLQARYWQASTLATTNTQDQGPGIEALAALVEAAPLHYYGVLALWRLSTLDPKRASSLTQRLSRLQGELRSTRSTTENDHARLKPTATPSDIFLARPGAKQAIELIRGGLSTEAGREVLRALGPKPTKTWDESTLVFAAHLLEAAADPYRSHNLLRRRFRTQFPKLAGDSFALLRAGYPLAFHDEVRAAMANFRWDPLLFQGLIREESAFAPKVVSWAGAMGLSQLMWPTAKETARKMGNSNLQRADLDDPTTNVSIGATYFDGLHRRWKGHLPLAVASYNAGPGAVGRWVKARGHLELDAFVETIPYDQTRHYVKRVLSSFQIYNMLYGDGLAVVPLRVGAVSPAIESRDPGLSGS